MSPVAQMPKVEALETDPSHEVIAVGERVSRTIQPSSRRDGASPKAGTPLIIDNGESD
jgi:hypothetical protein